MSILADVGEALQTVFRVCAEEANKVAQVVKRRRKFTPVTLAQAFVLALLQNPKANSEEIASLAAASGIDVTPQAVEQRYSPSLVEFFKVLFGEMAQTIVASKESLAPLLERFTDVIAIDGSVISLPDSQENEYQGCGGSYEGGKSALKLQTEFSLRNGQLRCVQIEQGRAPDAATDRQHIKQTKGSLRIADLGFFSIAVFQQIDDSDAYYLSRIQHQTRIYVDDTKFDLVTWLNARGQGVVDQQIEIGADARHSCRLIAWRVPEEIANRRRQKLFAATRKKTGRQPTAASLDACDWEFLLTNVPEAMLSVKEAIVLYRARWQIELLFKRWKSTGEIDEFDGRNDTIKMARFWARLCAALLQHWLSVAATWSPTLDVSLAKTAKLIRQFAKDIAIALSEGEDLIVTLKRLCRMAQAGCRRTKRKANPGTLELLRNPELLQYVLT